MSVESISWALNVTDERLTAVDRLVLIGIANHDGDGGAWPSVATLSRYAGVVERSVGRSLARLEQLGYITRHVQQGGTTKMRAGQRPNLYELHRTPDPSVTPDRTVAPPPTEVSGVPPTDGSPEPSIEPSEEPSTPYSPPTGSVEQVPKWEVFFNQFWEAYPRKVAKPAAKRAMKKAWKKGRPEMIAEGTRAWIAFYEFANIEEQFIPHPATFLNQERYNDPIPETQDCQPKPDTPMGILKAIAERDHQ